MWNNDKSVKLTHFLVRAFYFVLLAVSIAAPFLINNEKVYAVIDVARFMPTSYLVPFYFAVPAGFAALVCLDKLLCNIKKDLVFVETNVKLLRILSWCCIYASAVSLLPGVILCFKGEYEFFFFIFAIAEFFVGVVVRVVKNCFEKAIIIKDENDLTI